MQTTTQRTTIDLDQDKMLALKQLAIADRVSLKGLVNQAVGEYVERRQTQRRRGPTEILKEMKEMSKWGKQGVNLTRAIIEQRERWARGER